MNQQAQALGRLAKGKRKTMTPEAIDARKRNLARANEALKKKRDTNGAQRSNAKGWTR